MMSKRCTRERLNGVWRREHGVFTKGRKMEIGRRMEGARGCDFYFYFAPKERRGGGVAFIPWTWTERAVWGVGYLYIGIQLLEYLLDLAGKVCIAMCLRHGSGWPIQKILSGESVAPVDSVILVCKRCPKTPCLSDWTHRAHRQKSITIHWHDDNLYLIILYLGSASDFHLTVRVNVPVRLPATSLGTFHNPYLGLTLLTQRMSLFIYLCLSKGNSSYGLEFVVVCVFGVYHALGAEVEFVALGALVPDFIDRLWNVSMFIILSTPQFLRRW